MKPNTLSIDFHGETLALHPEGAIWWPSEHTLILSDVHLGKSATFRAHGLPVPEGESGDDLRRITKLVADLHARSLFIVGDFFHSRSILTNDLKTTLSQWLADLPCEVLIILGNHDPLPHKLTDIPEATNLFRPSGEATPLRPRSGGCFGEHSHHLRPPPPPVPDWH